MRRKLVLISAGILLSVSSAVSCQPKTPGVGPVASSNIVLVNTIRLYRQSSDQQIFPVFGPALESPSANPHPSDVQVTVSPIDKIFLGVRVNADSPANVTFTKYILFSKSDGQEKDIGLPPDQRSLAPGEVGLLGFTSPWAVPNETGTYEIRLYQNEDFIASAVFEVKIYAVSAVYLFPVYGDFGLPPTGGWERIISYPYPTRTQLNLHPGDKLFMAMSINPLYPENVNFTKYTLFNMNTSAETVLNFSSRDLGPFVPGNQLFPAIADPWIAPNETANYEIRAYSGNEILASAVFAVSPR